MNSRNPCARATATTCRSSAVPMPLRYVEGCTKSIVISVASAPVVRWVSVCGRRLDRAEAGHLVSARATSTQPPACANPDRASVKWADCTPALSQVAQSGTLARSRIECRWQASCRRRGQRPGARQPFARKAGRGPEGRRDAAPPGMRLLSAARTWPGAPPPSRVSSRPNAASSGAATRLAALRGR